MSKILSTSKVAIAMDVTGVSDRMVRGFGI